MNILLSSVGRRVELVRAFQSAFQRLGIHGQVIGTDVDPLAPAMQVVDVPVVVPRVNDPEFIPTVVALCKTRQIKALFPLIDPEIAVLAESKEVIESTGAKLAADVESAAISADKWTTYKFLNSVGVKTPFSWTPDGTPPRDLSFPVFIKPRFGSASENTFKVRNEAELEFFCHYVEHPIIQEYLPGPEVTSDIVCDLNGNLVSIISRERIAVRGGEAIKAVTIKDERIRNACERIVESLSVTGPITAQCMMKSGEPYFIEINARLGGGVPLAIAAGVDIPAILIKFLEGRHVDSEVETEYTEGVYMCRCDESFFVSSSEINEIRSNSI